MAETKEPMPRNDIPFERLHQRMVNACMEYEQAMARKKVRVEQINIVYDPNKEPFYSLDIKEKKLQHVPRRIDVLAQNPPPPSGALLVDEEEDNL